METFEAILLILFAALLLTAAARRAGVPYPVMLALGGAGLALLPEAPSFTMDPHLILALFLAPVLLDAAYDTSLRDLRANWVPVGSLVLVAVGLTVVAVALVAKMLVPGMPLAAAVALGAIVAPPDAASAVVILRQVRIPHRLRVILEGESLLNDASALLVYNIAVGAAMAGTFAPASIGPAFALGVIGSVVCGWVLAEAYSLVTRSVTDPPTSIILQFLGTFGIWILAERLGLSAIVTVVTYGITIARRAPIQTPARMRLPSYAVWETVVLLLNVFAFVLIGLQLRQIMDRLPEGEIGGYLLVAGAVLLTVIVVRIAWVLSYDALVRWRAAGRGGLNGRTVPTFGGGLIVSWSGMRGIVTLAAAIALPEAPDFPYRDLIVLCAFVTVLGTLVIQGLTLQRLIRRVGAVDDGAIEREISLARDRLARAALAALGDGTSPDVEFLRRKYTSSLETEPDDPLAQTEALRLELIRIQRAMLVRLRSAGEIGDEAFHAVEERLDWAEMSLAQR
ncbi:cation:proton antiporter [Arenibaculum pallidiluteum]|uniref:cation:proton antiporter n=1 Tax=Arenibaculum pallidiluteum TaxID=2812559 RepID=UPI001A974654|nr:sodium:proton antiporter [Arenibaculum pallidiluteum]